MINSINLLTGKKHYLDGSLAISPVNFSHDLTSLPTDILQLVFAKIPAKSHLRLVCKRWRELCKVDEKRDMIWDVASKAGWLSLLKWAHASKFYLNETTWLIDAIHGGHLDTLKWLNSLGSPIPDCAFKYAAFIGNLEMVKWLDKKHDYSWSNDEFQAAAYNGHLDVLKWLHKKGVGWDNEKVSEAALEGNDPRVLGWLQEVGILTPENSQ